jgi:hypothetical protein
VLAAKPCALGASPYTTRSFLVQHMIHLMRCFCDVL